MPFKRILNAVGQFLRKASAVPKPRSQHPNPSSISNLFTENDTKASKASRDLMDAIKTLSQHDKITHIKTHQPPSSSTFSADQQNINFDVETATMEELENSARMFFKGTDVIAPDQTRAVTLWAKAAERGSIEARYSFALCLKDGIGVSQDPGAALSHLQYLADEHNYNLAHYSLAVMYDKGDGIPQDLVKAFQHFKKAALGGVTPALHNIGNCYAEGKGVKQNDKNALLYYQAGDEAGDPFSIFTLATWHYKGRADLSVDIEKAFRLQMKAAEKGHPPAMFNIGVALLTGDGAIKDREQAIHWLQKASDAKIPEASLNLAKVYMEGDQVTSEALLKAQELLQPLANNNNEVAVAMLKEIEAKKSIKTATI